MYPASPALGKFYIVTDGNTHPEEGVALSAPSNTASNNHNRNPVHLPCAGAYLIFWRVVDEAIVGMGFTSMWDKMKLPVGGEWAAVKCQCSGGACVTRLL